MEIFRFFKNQKCVNVPYFEEEELKLCKARLGFLDIGVDFGKFEMDLR